jgi:uroporphyrinogen decarboxylase
MLILNAANAASENNILHICGYEGVRNRLAAWRNYPAKAYNWAVNVEGVALSEGKALFSGKAVIGGFANPKGSLIDTGTREEIETFVAELLQKTGKRGVVIGADCTVNSEITPERYEWVRQAAARA